MTPTLAERIGTQAPGGPVLGTWPTPVKDNDLIGSRWIARDDSDKGDSLYRLEVVGVNPVGEAVELIVRSATVFASPISVTLESLWESHRREEEVDVRLDEINATLARLPRP